MSTAEPAGPAGPTEPAGPIGRTGPAGPADRPGPSDPLATFERARPRLLGLAYRMLGTMADSEDVVQEAWLRWQATSAATATATAATAGAASTATATAATAAASTAGGGPGIERPDAWLTTVTTRLALDRLRTTRRRREDYIGPWLPEPVVVAPGPEESAELSESLTLGFLTVFEKLQPVERAVFLMADVFGVAYPDVAEAVGKSEVACRQIASRARRRLRERPARPHAAIDRKIVDELLVAVALGDVETAMARLAPDAVLVSDGGAKRRAARRPVVGAARIVRLLVNLAHRESESIEVAPVTVNGDPGIVVTLNGAVDLVAAFELDGERVAAIWMVRNPDKLENLAQPIVLA